MARYRGVMTATIRRATQSDAPALGALHSSIWAELYPKDLPADVLAQLNPGYMEHLWTKFTSRGEAYRQWVAMVGEEIVGFIGTGPGRDTDATPDDSEIYFLYVTPAHRKTGIGSALLAAADPTYVWVWEQFKGTRKFYAAEGFAPEIVLATRGRGPRTRVGVLFGSAYQTEFKLKRPHAA